jgi:GTP cyclohydrolase II
MQIPELEAKLEVDGKIVTPLGINCIKAAIDHVWLLPPLATLLNMDEKVMRAALADATQNSVLEDGTRNAYLPPIGGISVYFIGDPSKLADPTTEVAVRCHDACCGSDVFGTDICTWCVAFTARCVARPRCEAPACP